MLDNLKVFKDGEEVEVRIEQAPESDSDQNYHEEVYMYHENCYVGSFYLKKGYTFPVREI